MTTKEIIQLLSLDPELKARLLDTYDTLSEEEKCDVQQLVWGTYTAEYNMKLEAKIEEKMQQVADGKAHLDKDFYKRIEEEVKLEMKSVQSEQEAHGELASTREELEKLLNKSN